MNFCSYTIFSPECESISKRVIYLKTQAGNIQLEPDTSRGRGGKLRPTLLTQRF